jgi:hypothetical protein
MTSLGTSFPKSFTYNPATQEFFLALYGTGEGFYKMTIPELETIKDVKALAPYAKYFADGSACTQRVPTASTKDTEGAAPDEPVGITQLAIDEVTGRVYFALRSDDVKSGIVYYDPADDKLHYLVEGVEAYAVTINPNQSKLF